jgi:hypothetical protein
MLKYKKVGKDMKKEKQLLLIEAIQSNLKKS